MNAGKQTIFIKKSHVISMAHRLLGHPGKCKNLHGHNYTITYHIASRQYDSEHGMIADFGDVKKFLCNYTDGALDHKTCLEEKDPYTKMFLEQVYNGDVQAMAGEFFVMDKRPTAENLASAILFNVNEHAAKHLGPQVVIVQVDVEETPGAVASAMLAE